MADSISGYRQRVYHFLFDQHHKSGRRCEALLGFLALLSVIVIFIESGVGSEYQLTYEQWHLFVWAEFFSHLSLLLNIFCGY